MNAYFGIKGAPDIAGDNSQEIWPVVAGFTSAGVLMLLCVASLGWSVVWLIKFAGGLP